MRLRSRLGDRCRHVSHDTRNRRLSGAARLPGNCCLLRHVSRVFTLIEKVGPARAAYALTVVPIVAITISVIFEGLHIDTRLAFGGATILLGKILVLNA
ncbi:hypothetical protein [Rhizobium sp.]